MTFQRRTALRLIAHIRARCGPTSRIVVGGYDPSLAARRLRRPGSASTSSSAAKASITFRELLRALEARRRRSHRIAGPVVPRRASGFVHNRRSAGQLAAARRRSRLPNRAARVLERLHAARPPGRRRRDLARLHVRLQLLLDHRDARPQLPHLSTSSACSPTSATRGARRARDLPRRRQHHARRPPLRGALPRRSSTPASTTSTTSCRR